MRTPSTATSPTIAVFDFDDTLAKGDSFFPFLIMSSGFLVVALAFISELVAYHVWWRFRGCELRTHLKDRLLKTLIKGRPIADLHAIAERMRTRLVWIEPQLAKLHDHHRQGHHIVIASGGLDIYLPILLRDIPHHALICTDIGVVDGIATGIMIHGNCVRACKADRVAHYIKSHGGFTDSWGYGNAPHDLPMLALMKHQTVV